MRRSPRLAVGVCLILGLIGLALVSLVWTPDDPTRMHIGSRLRPPFEGGLAGTDAFGRDVCSMLMVGARNSLAIAFASIALGSLVGTGLGLVAATFDGRVAAAAIMRACDALFAVPSVLSAILFGALIGTGATTAVLAIALFTVPVFGRVVRSAALRVRARDYILAARMAGKGEARITLDHILPNIAGQLAVQVAIQLALAILTEAGLSFLGLGMAPPAPSWGRMLADSQTFLMRAPYLAIAPGIAIAVAVLGFNLLGDGLRDILDPRRELDA